METFQNLAHLDHEFDCQVALVDVVGVADFLNNLVFEAYSPLFVVFQLGLLLFVFKEVSHDLSVVLNYDLVNHVD